MSIKGTNQNRRLNSTDFDTCQPIEGEIVFNNVTNVIKSKVNTKCAFYHPTCDIVQYGNAVPIGCFTPTLQAVCQFVDTRTANLTSMPTINSVATHIPVFASTNTTKLIDCGFTINDLVPAGTIIIWPAIVPPTKYFMCDGRTLNKADYPLLCSVINITYGGTNPSNGTFKIPDLRGLFVRGLDCSAGIDAGRTLFTVQQDSIESHSHTVGYVNNTNGGTTGIQGSTGTNNLTLNTSSTAASTPDETRPVNIAMVYCIKYT